MAELLRIWIKRFHRGPMDAVTRATLVAGRGIAGNANQGGSRQVTVLAQPRWDEVVAALGLDADPALRRANLLVSELHLAQSRGRILRIGGCRVRLLGETRPCAAMDEALPGLQAALDANWGGGAYGEVLDDGEIVTGEQVTWEES
jgi:MOSC domain-containing protein YiiM